MQKKPFKTPTVVREWLVQWERDFLAASIVNDLETVETTGQDVETLDFDSSGIFNHSWDEG
ncbi:MAG: hypothetical protein IJ721_08910 [Bacteroidales bacterium]|nr:hypothetical protein [Bacteroidales bacterium]